MRTYASSARGSSRASSLEAGRPARPCGCHGDQARLRIGPQNDPLEREADRTADAIVAGQPLAPLGSAAVAPQRKCASCAAEDQEQIHRSPASDAGPAATAQPSTGRAEVAARAVASGGRPLEPALRRYFEPRFGADLSNVRVHTGGDAAGAANDLHAHAFTLGSDIAFAPRAFAPESPAGRRLIAHELTHVVQQRRGESSAIQREGRPGTSEFEDELTTPMGLVLSGVNDPGGVYRGDMRRRVFAPASGTAPRQKVHEATVPVEFNPNSCSVRLPHTYAFTPGEAGAADICNEPPRPQAVPAVSAARVREIQTSYLQAVNDGLQNWYAVRLEGDACPTSCRNQDMPIRVDATPATGGAADTTIMVSPRGGRADAASICAPDFNTGTTIHEGGHQVLGAGDEYRETDPAVLARAPQWAGIERVRTDSTYMGSHHVYGRFALFHERHFAHVTAFLRSVFPECSARLVELSRPVLPDFRLSFGTGYARLGGSNLPYLDVGLEMGIPLSRLRNWEFVMGPHGRYLASADPKDQSAFLIGARFGLEHTANPAEGGFRLGAFGEVGGGGFRPSSAHGAPDPGFRAAPYGEVGVRTGYRFGGSFAPSVGLEAAAGSTFTRIPGAEHVADDPRAFTWLRLGVHAAFEF